MATKDHWRYPSRYEWIETGLYLLAGSLLNDYRYHKSVALPALGCGNCGLDWMLVKPMIEKMFAYVPQEVVVYEPL